MRPVRVVSPLVLLAHFAAPVFAQPQIYAVKAPTSASTNEDVTITWSTNSGKRITHADVHWGTSPGSLTATSAVFYTQGPGTYTYSAKVRTPASDTTVYFLVHARDADGDRRTVQQAIVVKKSGTTNPGATSPTPSPSSGFVGNVARLHADVNRDGTIDSADDAGRDQWNAARGAVFAFNNDDDDQNGRQDCADPFTNGVDDVRTMARIVVGKVTSTPSVATISFAPSNAPVRVFRRFGATSSQLLAPGVPSATLAPGDLAVAPIELRVEATAPRSLSWDGTVRVTLDLGTSKDTVALRCAPLVYVDNTRPPERVYAMRVVSGQGQNMPFWNALSSGLASQGVSLFEVRAASYGYDRWVQDGMQLGYQGYQGKNGSHAWINDFNQLERGRGLGSLVPGELLGRNQGMSYGGKGQDDSANYGGNLEVIPPHQVGTKEYPFGRIYIGGGSSSILGQPMNRHMNREELNLLNAQVQGPVIEISSEWLAVGHVDEFSQVVPNRTGTGRSWKMVWSSPALARAALRTMQKKGLGSARVFQGRETETTVNAILANTALMRFNDGVQQRLDRNKQKLIQECGLTANDFVEVPTLFEDIGYGGLDEGVAYNPGCANMVPIGDTVYVPDPEGPNDAGTDVWRKQVSDALTSLGIKVVFLDVFESYHQLLGEAHCGTNVQYRAYDAPWWTK